MEVPLTILSSDTYELEVVAWANHAGEGLPMLNVVVEAADGSGAGSAAIRNKLVELYDKLLGVQVTPPLPRRGGGVPTLRQHDGTKTRGGQDPVRARALPHRLGSVLFRRDSGRCGGGE